MAVLKLVVIGMTLMLLATVVNSDTDSYRSGTNRYPTSVPEVYHTITQRLKGFEALKQHEVYRAASDVLAGELGDLPRLWLDVNKLKQLLKDDMKSLMNSTTSCAVDFLFTLEMFILKQQPWAVTMFDSYGKLGSGLTQGNTRWPGSFSLCRSVVHTPTTKFEPHNPIKGQYCWVDFQLTPSATEGFTNESYVPPLQTAVCVPNSCTEKVLNDHFSKDFFVNSSFLKKYLKFAGISCIPEEHNFWDDKKAVTCFAILCIFLLLLILGTTYDAYICISTTHNTRVPYQKMNESNITPVNNDINEGSAEDAEKSDVNAQTRNAKDTTKDTTSVVIRQPSKNVFVEFLLAFSIYTNGKKIFSITPSKESLEPLNGIRFFSMTWVILGHTYLFASVMTDNMLVLVDVVKSLAFQLVGQGTMSVDSFFVMSGLLLTYLYLKEHARTNGKINWFKFYIHRYWRLTPPYILVLFLICDGTAKYFSNGPFWPQVGFDKDHCSKSWWWNVLYINNFQPVKDMCMGHTWYLANDMQFYIISPLILIPLTRFLPLAAAAGGTFMIASWIATGLISSHYQIGAAIDLDVLSPGSPKYGVMFDNIYDKPYCRIGPYIVGMACGWLLFKTKCKAKLQWYWVVLGWLLAAGCNLSVVFGLYHNSPGIPVSALYQSLSRTAWAVGLSWVIFACCNGYGGVVNHILSWPAWNPLSRLTYCAYLWHLTLVYTIIYSSDVIGHFSHTTMIYYYIANIIVSYAGALILSLAFESPMLALEKLIIPSRRS